MTHLTHRRIIRNRWLLVLLISICIAPVLLSYLSYYVIKPKGASTNYGQLIQPQRPIPQSLKGIDFTQNEIALTSLIGKWWLISFDSTLECNSYCQQKLFYMRQIQATQGVQRERLQTLWLKNNTGHLPDRFKENYPNIKVLSVQLADISNWLTIDNDTQIDQYLYLIDPFGNLMMKFPKSPDPSKIKKDITKLLKWSRIG